MKKEDTALTRASMRTASVHPLVRFDYMPRIIGFIMHGVILCTLFYESRNPVLWSAIFLQTIVWPHIAYLAGRFSRDGKRAEYRNQLFEAFLCGVWMNLVSFQLWPSTVFLIGAAINLLATRGLNHFRNALLFLGGGILTAGLLNGFRFVPESSIATAFACIGFMMVYTSIVAYLSYRTSKKLSVSRERTNAILNAIQTGMIVIDVESHQIIEVNPAAEKMLGLGRKELIGRVCHQFICPAEEGKCPITDLEQTVDSSERVLLNKDGEAIPILKTAKSFMMDGKKCLVESFFDISERKQMEEELRRLARAVEQSIDGIAVTDLDGNIRFINTAWAAMHGLAAEELLGKHLQIFHSREQLESEVKPFNALVSQNGSNQGEVGHVRKDGSSFPTWMTTTVLTDEDGRPYGLLGIARDITDQKQAEEELRRTLQKVESVNIHLEEQTARANQMAAQAEAANTAKSQFLANMSHEIRTPMNAIVGMTYFLLDSELSEEQQHYANLIQQSAGALLTIINEILDFSKIEAGKLQLEYIDFNLIQLLDEMNDMLSIDAQEKGLEYICDIDPDVPQLVSGDPGRIRQVLVNLVGNAIKFTSRGRIRIHVSRSQNGIADHEDKTVLMFQIEDTGVGIPAEKIGTLFDAFTQVDASTTREYGGTGLGLTIAKNLIEMMEGELSVASQLGEGSVFTFTMVVQDAASGEKPDAGEDTTSRSSAGKVPAKGDEDKVHILVAEDFYINQEVVLGFLERFGFKVHIVENGRQAIQALSEKQYDLVLMDVQMPEMDGLEATTIIRDPNSNVLNHDIVIIALTGHALKGDRQRYLDAGMNDYLAKPIEPQALYDVVIRNLPD